MPTLQTTHGPDHAAVSPLMLADRMLTLAQDADRAGYVSAADRLLKLAYTVWDRPPAPRA